jgi:hypothetical protein
MFFIAKEIQMAAYLFASILFILSLGGLSSQESAKRGVMLRNCWDDCSHYCNRVGEGVAGQVSTSLLPLPLLPSLD